MDLEHSRQYLSKMESSLLIRKAINTLNTINCAAQKLRLNNSPGNKLCYLLYKREMLQNDLIQKPALIMFREFIYKRLQPFYIAYKLQ